MSDVTRYRPTVTNVQATAYCGAHPDGEYVKVEDYDRLRAERDLDREVRDALIDERDALRGLLAHERGCGECWKGKPCGADCHMTDVAALAGAADQPHDNNADVIVQAKLASTLNPHPMLSPTHSCKDCGALWRQNDDFSVSLRSRSGCEACNNTPVGGQLVPLSTVQSAAVQFTPPTPLRAYISHEPDCSFVTTEGIDCDCGARARAADPTSARQEP